MSRQTIPLATADVSAFARHLSTQLERNTAPGHLELLNMLARAAGFRNFQHLRAAATAKDRLDAPEPSFDQTLALRALRHFDEAGSLRDCPHGAACKSSAYGRSGHASRRASPCTNASSARP